MTAFILAAGYATRLYPYTLDMPKPLLEVSGKPIIDYIVDSILTLPDVVTIVVITNDKFYAHFCKWRDTKNNPQIKVLNDGTSSVESRLGAIGDIGFALEKTSVCGDLLVIAGDNLFTFDLNEQYEFFKSKGGECISVKKLHDTEALKSLGVCEVDEKTSLVTGFEEKPQEPKSDLAVYASYMFRQGSLHFIADYLAKGNKKDAPGFFIEWLHKNTDVYAYFIDGECYDIGTVEAYEGIRDNF